MAGKQAPHATSLVATGSNRVAGPTVFQWLSARKPRLTALRGREILPDVPLNCLSFRVHLRLIFPVRIAAGSRRLGGRGLNINDHYAIGTAAVHDWTIDEALTVRAHGIRGNQKNAWSVVLHRNRVMILYSAALFLVWTLSICEPIMNKCSDFTRTPTCHFKGEGE
jgi:hypothetical protein